MAADPGFRLGCGAGRLLHVGDELVGLRKTILTLSADQQMFFELFQFRAPQPAQCVLLQDFLRRVSLCEFMHFLRVLL